MLATSYAITWAITALCGGPQLEKQWLEYIQDVPQSEVDYASKQLQDFEQLRQQLLEEIRTAEDASFVEAMRSRDLDPIPPDAYPSFSAEATCIAPFIVVIKSGRVLAPLCGSGRSTIHLWFFGLTLEVTSYGYWVA